MNKSHTSPYAPLGWSTTMKRWLAGATDRTDPAVRWTAAIDDGNCTAHVSLDEIRAVRVEDLSQVLDHRIARIMGSTSHVIRFIGGGELRYAYNNRGQVIELSATGVKGAVSANRVVTFRGLGPGPGGAITPPTPPALRAGGGRGSGSHRRADEPAPAAARDCHQANFRFEVSETLRQRSFWAQYRESDFEFMTRPLAEENLSYHWEHGGPWRGSGFELASQAWITLRAAKGLFVTTTARAFTEDVHRFADPVGG